MITIRRFHPFDGLARLTWEFRPDRILISMRSLTRDNHREVLYRNILRVHRFRHIDFGWINRACALILWAGLGLLLYQFFQLHIPAFWIVEKVLVIAALIMAVPGFWKNEYVEFLGQNGVTLAILKLQRRTLDSEETAISLICRKNKIHEDSFADELPKRKPIHTIEQLTPLNYWDRYRILFYEDRIIDQTQSLIRESTIINNYRSLNGKVTTAWLGDNSWSFVWCYWLYLIATIAYVPLLFYPKFLYHNWIFIGMLEAGFALLIPLYLLKFWKRETWILLDRSGGQALSIRVTSRNRENLERIAAFVSMKVKSKRQKPA